MSRHFAPWRKRVIMVHSWTVLFATELWLDQGQLTGAVFIDLRKAFDTVDHAVLLDKLSNLGIVDKEHGWFTDYLSNRTQVVEFQGVTSTPEAISVGVPQGSILGPLLFILHINDLPEVVSECNILIFYRSCVNLQHFRSRSLVGISIF